MQEPDAAELSKAIQSDEVRLISAATLLEASLVLEGRLGEAAGWQLDLFIQKMAAHVEPVTADQVEFGRHAHRRYGKGRDRAGLNFGNCFSYALAKITGQPLLFKGDDFSQTDVGIALEPGARDRR